MLIKKQPAIPETKMFSHLFTLPYLIRIVLNYQERENLAKNC